MTYRFQIVRDESFTTGWSNSRTIRGLDNQEHSSVHDYSFSTIYQVYGDGSRVMIARFQKIFYCLGDFEDTDIFYSGGSLHCVDNWDMGYVTDHHFLHRPDGPGFTICDRPTSRDFQKSLLFEEVHYPVRTEKDEKKNVAAKTVYRPTDHGYVPLARLSRVNETFWEVLMEDWVSHPVLCIAICML